MLGYQKDELIGKKAETLFTVATKIFNQTHFYPLLKMQGFAEEIFVTLQQSNGESLPVLLNAVRRNIDSKEVNLYVGIIVHHRKKFEEELIAAKKTAEAALNENSELAKAKLSLQKHAEELDRQISIAHKQNEELRQFNRVVTHDMQEPLRKLSLFSGILLKSREVEEQQKLVDKINKVSGQMRNILNGLQQYVWLNETSLKIEHIDLNRLLMHVQQQLQEDFSEVEIEITKEGENALMADHDQMQLLLYELLSNAIRFKKDNDKTCIHVSVEQLQLNQFRNVEGRYKYVDYMRLQIRDYGKGFNAEYKAQVFELFKRLHAESGRGVGLALCKKIAENHLGMISIDSELNEGTTVTVYLPNHLSKTNFVPGEKAMMNQL